LRKEIALILSPAQAYSEESYLPVIACELGVLPHEISAVRIIRKSIDARGRNIKVNISFEVFLGEEASSPVENSFHYEDVHDKAEVVVGFAGFGIDVIMR